MKALDLSKYVIARMTGEGDEVTNKRLQKFLYYIEAWGQVKFGGLVDEDFEAWVHGPVVPSVYEKYGSFGKNPISLDYGKKGASKYADKMRKTMSIGLENADEKFDFIDDVLDEYGLLTTFQMELIFSMDGPWSDSRGNSLPTVHSTGIIPKKDIKEFYSIYDRKMKSGFDSSIVE